MLKGKDNRKYFRSVSDLKVLYCRQNQNDFHEGTTRDFSATGLSFIGKIPPDIGEVIKIKISLKDTDTVIETSAFVVRTTNEDDSILVSIQFYDIDYHDFIKLLDYSLAFQI